MARLQPFELKNSPRGVRARRVQRTWSQTRLPGYFDDFWGFDNFGNHPGQANYLEAPVPQFLGKAQIFRQSFHRGDPARPAAIIRPRHPSYIPEGFSGSGMHQATLGDVLNGPHPPLRSETITYPSQNY